MLRESALSRLRVLYDFASCDETILEEQSKAQNDTQHDEARSAAVAA